MRIRCVKPEFWSSESIGRLSRDARLLFIGLWSFADDSGRGRGAFPAIWGNLLPYDKDALTELPKWFAELEKEKMVSRYVASDGNTYYEIHNWLKHQKIEKPSKSKFPAISEGSPTIPRILPDISPLDQGSGIRDQGSLDLGSGGSGNHSQAPSESGSVVHKSTPTLELVLHQGAMAGVPADYCRSWYNDREVEDWRDARGNDRRQTWLSWLKRWWQNEQESRAKANTCGSSQGHQDQGQRPDFKKAQSLQGYLPVTQEQLDAFDACQESRSIYNRYTPEQIEEFKKLLPPLMEE
jgi:hypothetical protein